MGCRRPPGSLLLLAGDFTYNVLIRRLFSIALRRRAQNLGEPAAPGKGKKDEN
jgi:hypothetical protein